MGFRRLTFRRVAIRTIMTMLIVGLSVALVGSLPASSLERVLARGVLRMVTLEGPTTYYESAQGKDGFEYLLAKAFAEHLNVQLEVSVGKDLNAVLLSLTGPQASFAAASLTVTNERSEWLNFSEPYDQVRQVLIYQRGTPRPKIFADLKPEGRLIVVAGSSHDSTLKKLQETQHPELRWETLDNSEMLGLMQLVHSGQADYAVIDSSAFSINRSIYPNARQAFYLSEPEPIAWAFPQHSDASLAQAANQFLEQYRASGQLKRLKQRFYSPTDAFSIGGSQLFISRVNKRLPRYEDLFRITAEQYKVDWHLLAAIAYQESHWNPLATSPTGVRGLMMLTQDTAREVGVSNLLDPEQSLRGGVKYYLKIKKRLPKSILEPDRTWFALAAYNIGLGHLEDARVLTQRDNSNPNHWGDVQRYLPLLRQKKYYKSVRHGYARGNEPVNYVRNIRHFHTILRWHSQEQARMLQAELDEAENNWHPSNLSSL